MRFFPIFMNLAGRRVIVSGAGETAVAKLRLLLKTEARISVFGKDPVQQVVTWANEGKIALVQSPLSLGDATCAAMVYGANDDPEMDHAAVEVGRAAGAITNIVDNLEDSQFITAAMVDRDPVTIAIGTEGAAPVLARHIKKQLEESLPANLGILARIGKSFRPMAARLPFGRARRDFWAKFYFDKGPKALVDGGEDATLDTLDDLLLASLNETMSDGHVSIIGAGPGDPELLTLKARNILHEADVVIHDALVPSAILELARREAVLVAAGKRGFKRSWSQTDINAEMINHAQRGMKVVRLKGGDPTVFARLDEELEALESANVPYDIVPGITAASAAVASIGQSLTKRGRNSALRILTGHDIDGFAAHDWRELASIDATAAIYMGKAAARFITGRLMMHGVDPAKPVTVVANASRPDQRIYSGTVFDLPDLTAQAGKDPAVILLGISPRKITEKISVLSQVEQA